MQPEQIILTIEDDATVQVEVKGVKGAGCEGLTSSLIEQLGGEVISENKTAEYYQQPVNSNANAFAR